MIYFQPYKARALYTKIDSGHRFDDDYCNGAVQPLNRPVEQIDTPIQLKLYPNPVEDYLLIELDRAFAETEAVLLYNALGHLLQVQVMKSEENSLLLETDKLKAGVYLIEVKTIDGKSLSQKFIKE